MHRLNPQQELAVKHVEGPLLVIAGAGSGKTRVVTFRIAHLLELGVPASEIVALTFTNKAAGEMRERVEKLAHQSVLTSTFHSLCARILRESISHFDYGKDFVIFDEEDSEKVLKECLAALNQTPEKGAVKTLLAQISRAKNALLGPENLKDEDPFFLSIYKLYQAKLKEYNALDFDDLLFLTVKLLQKFPDELEKYQARWTFILIDEYQDTNHAQYQLIKLLSGKKQNVFAVGDPDQSIYSWRGASIDNILNFERDFPGAKTITLEQNYRSRSNILEAANALISHNKGRYEKNLWSEKKEGEKIGLYIAPNEHAETDYVIRQIRKHHDAGTPLNECVIFYRTHFQSRIFEDALLKQRLPYVIVGGLSFYQRREIKDILAILRLILGGDWLSFARTINIPKRGFGESTLAKLRQYAQEIGKDVLTTCIEISQNKLEFKLSPKQAQGLKSYVEIILALRQLAKAKAPLHEIVSSAIELTAYIEYLKEDPDTYEERRENIEELKSKAAEWQEESSHPSLPLFLEELSLKSSHDEAAPSDGAIRMMTLHNSKGLEFDIVFIVGMEEELLPHMNAYESPEALEEERRLAYVGMTRAKECLYLTASYVRFLWGVRRSMQPSRFLSEIPDSFLQRHSPSPAFDQEAEQEERPFAPGQLVFHRDLGRGVVETSYQTSYGLTYEVFFPDAGITRTLVAKFAKLTPLSDQN